MISDLTNIGSMAQQFCKKPAALGGGEGDFDTFAIPANLWNNTANKSHYIATVTAATATAATTVAAIPTPATTNTVISGTNNPIYIIGYAEYVGNDGTNAVKAYCTVNATTGTIATTVVN
jgi:hypothetical protein